MDVEQTHGEVKVTEDGIIWSLPNYLNLTKSGCSSFLSPEFSFNNQALCCLQALQIEKAGERYLGTRCLIPELPDGSEVLCTLEKDGQVIGSKMLKNIGVYTLYCEDEYLEHSHLEDEHSEHFLGDGSLRVLLKIINSGKCQMDSECGVVPNLMKNYKDLYTQGDDHDLIFIVRGLEFKVHKCIIKARVPDLFESLKKNQVDCNPELFNKFLIFIYSGYLEQLDPGDARDMYSISKRFGLVELKELCLQRVQMTLSSKECCNVLEFAVNERERSIIVAATKMLASHAEDLLQTPKWLAFLKEKPDEANEIFLDVIRIMGKKSPNYH